MTESRILAKLDRYEAARREFQLAARGSFDRYKAGFNLTLAYAKGKNYGAAVKAGEGLVAGGYRPAELYSLLAQAYEGSGEPNDSLRVATELDPQDETSYLI